MNRKDKRQKIDQAIKDITIPFLREKGFKGSLPHFRRPQADGINLLTFQHSLYNTKFVVEIANCPIDGITTHWGKEIPKNKSNCSRYGGKIKVRKYKTQYRLLV